MSWFKYFSICICLVLSTILFSSSVMAQEEMRSSYYSNSIHKGPYLAAGIGPNIVYVSGHVGVLAGVNLLAGYQFNNYWAAEVGYMTSTMIFYHVKSWHGAAKGIIPCSDHFFLFGKLGVAEVEYGIRFNLFGDDVDVTDLQRKTGIFFGVGMEWGLTDNLGLTLSYDAVTAPIKYEDENEQLRKSNAVMGLLSLGLIYHFPM